MSESLFQLLPKSVKPSVLAPAPNKVKDVQVNPLVHSFQDVLKSQINAVDESEKTRDYLQQEVASGHLEYLHQAMMATAKASATVNFTMQLRTLALRSYNRLIQMR